MIVISGELPKYRACLMCQGHDDVREISMFHVGNSSMQGTIVALCRHCRKDLADQIIEHERRTDENC